MDNIVLHKHNFLAIVWAKLSWPLYMVYACNKLFIFIFLTLPPWIQPLLLKIISANFASFGCNKPVVLDFLTQRIDISQYCCYPSGIPIQFRILVWKKNLIDQIKKILLLQSHQVFPGQNLCYKWKGDYLLYPKSVESNIVLFVKYS